MNIENGLSRYAKGTLTDAVQKMLEGISESDIQIFLNTSETPKLTPKIGCRLPTDALQLHQE